MTNSKITIQLKDNYLYIYNAEEFTRYFTNHELFRRGYSNKTTKVFVGYASLEALEAIEKITTLSDELQKYKSNLISKKQRIDKELKAEKPSDLVTYPVKTKLYEHQQRAVNLALMTFEII